ncbi:DUF490 domain-containing protein [Alishewanella longhuensis]|uniref:DUF490 domain-containing protein n=1 Tax=Alishewanella longhuensis TaxID=1091037 RepID=A0ABQ3L3R1_9ALTE|nr:translocation/assembly module TamB domain-containing protein [Alishewanella longhuensis]GHG71715.1 DUF490 domain-containing protein [Alishewanella longhuensis]
MRLGKWLNRTLLLPLLAILLLLTLLLFSQPGLRFSVWLAEKLVAELTIEQSEGAWLTGVTLSGIHYQNETLDAKLDSLSLRLQKRCLIQFRLCIPELKLSGTAISLTAIDDSSTDVSATANIEEPAVNLEQQAEDATLDDTLAAVDPTVLASNLNPGIFFPIPLRVEQLILDDVTLSLPEQQLHWRHFSIGVVAWGNRLQLSNGRWQDIELTLAPAAVTSSEPITAYQAPELPDFTLPLSIYLDDFQLSNFRFTQGENSEQLERLTFSAQLAPRQIRVLDATALNALGQLQLVANVQLGRNYPLNAQLDATLHAGEFAGQRAQLKLAGDLSQLKVDVITSGLLNATLAAELALLTDDLPLQLTLESKQLQWPLTESLYQLSDTRLTVSGTLSALMLELNTRFNGQDLPDAQLKLSGSWQHWQQQAELTDLLLQTLGGDLRAKGKVQLAPELSWQLGLILNDIQPGLSWQDYPGRLSGKLDTAGSLAENGQLQLQLPLLQLVGELRELPFNLAGSLSLAGDTSAETPQLANWQIQTPGLTLSHGENRLDLRGELNKQWQLDGTLSLPELAASYPGLRGAVAGTVQLRGPALTPDIGITLSAERLAYQEGRLRQVELQAQISLADPIQSQITLSASQGRWQQQRLQQLALSLNGTELAHQLTLQVTADEFKADVALSGALTDREQWQGQFTEFAFQTPIGLWQLAAPLRLSASLPQQSLTLAQHCWQQAPATLCLTEDSTLTAEAASLQLALTDYQLAELNTLLPYQSTLQGDLAVQLSLDWQHGIAPSAAVTVKGSKGAFTQQLDVPVTLSWADFLLNSTLEQHQLRSQLDVNLGSQGKLHAQALVSDLAEADKPLRAEIQLEQLTLDFLKPLLDEYSELAGTLSSQLSVNGTLANPTLQGEIRLDALKVRGKLAPTDIEQADLVVNFIGEQATLTGQVKTPEGAIALTGDANWQDLDNWRAAMQIKGDELKLQIPQAVLFVKPDLQINAQPGRSRISGIVQIPRANITVDSLPQNAVGLSADQILLNRRLQPISVAQANTFAIETDIRVRLGQQVRLSAFGLKTRLNGELRVQQQQINPTVRGEVTLQDGTFRAYGQDLLIRQGKMTFSGPADQPFLNVEAIRNPANMEDDVIAGIRVTGPADEPLISIFSEPSKPQANALSYLIMGRDLDSESGSAANSVTTSLIGMSIASSGRLVGEIGEAFGVSDLTLDTEGAGDNSQVTVSGYLTRDLQLKYGIGIFQPIGQFTLRYRLMRSLFLEAVSGMDNAVDLLYKFEFD